MADTFRCNCEHEDHFLSPPTPHRYLDAFPLADKGGRADFVGDVCRTCAEGHLSGYMLEG